MFMYFYVKNKQLIKKKRNGVMYNVLTSGWSDQSELWALWWPWSVSDDLIVDIAEVESAVDSDIISMILVCLCKVLH